MLHIHPVDDIFFGIFYPFLPKISGKFTVKICEIDVVGGFTSLGQLSQLLLLFHNSNIFCWPGNGQCLLQLGSDGGGELQLGSGE